MKIVQMKVDQAKNLLAKKFKRGTAKFSKRAQLIEAFADANIPPIYWFLKVEDFSGPKVLLDSIHSFRDDMESWFNDGKFVVMLGNYGTGKTTACSMILKMAIINKKTVYYTTLSDLVGYMTDYNVSKEFSAHVSRVDLLCIDEIDDRHFSKSDEAQKLFGSTFEKVVRYRNQNGLPTLMASNNSSMDEVFTGQYKRVVDSLLAKAKTVLCLGEDNRKKI